MCKIIPRIKLLAEHEGITIGALERIIGASKGVISRAVNNGTDIQSKWLQSIVENYPQYSAEWLLTGQGDMLRSSVQSFDAPASTVFYNAELSGNCESNQTRPRIPYDASAGALSFAVDGIKSCQCERLQVIPTFPKYDFTIIARGDSMLPDFMSGDELACTFVSESSFIQWGRVHVLDTAQGVVLKRIFNQKDSILCKSINRDYPDFDIPKDEVYHIAIVVGLLRRL